MKKQYSTFPLLDRPRLPPKKAERGGRGQSRWLRRACRRLCLFDVAYARPPLSADALALQRTYLGLVVAFGLGWLLAPNERWSMKFPKIALVTGSLLFVLTARIDAQGLGVLGQGNVSCSSWLENHTSNDARTAWILGFVTAFNQYSSSKPSDVSQGTTAEEMVLFITKYCGNHPTDNLYQASAALVDQFRQKPGQ